MARDGGTSARFTAYALAFELGWSDVDAMLESMTAMQYKEWLAFIKIRNKKDGSESEDEPKGDGTSKEEQDRLGGHILRAMTGYQKRRDKLKG